MKISEPQAHEACATPTGFSETGGPSFARGRRFLEDLGLGHPCLRDLSQRDLGVRVRRKVRARLGFWTLVTVRDLGGYRGLG